MTDFCSEHGIIGMCYKCYGYGNGEFYKLCLTHNYYYTGACPHCEIQDELRSSKPHIKCPVCEGRGQVPAGFYYDSVVSNRPFDQCKCCSGKGII